MKKLFTLLSMGVTLFAQAQAPSFQWAKSMGGTNSEEGHSISTDASGNVYTVGALYGIADFDPSAATFTLDPTKGHTYVSKLDGAGNFVWAKNFGGIGSTFNVLRNMTADAAGNVYISGSYSGFADFDPGVGLDTATSKAGNDIFIVKLNITGNLVWVKKIGNTNTFGTVTSIAVDGTGNVYTSGYYAGIVDFNPGSGIYNLPAATAYNTFVLKLDGGGNFLWAKGAGNSQNSFSNGLSLDATGNAYTTGQYKGIIDFDSSVSTYTLAAKGDDDMYILKLDANGNFVWAKTIGDTLPEFPSSIVVDGLNNVYTTGVFRGTVDFDPNTGLNTLSTNTMTGASFISKLDGAGNFIWVKQFDLAPNDRTKALAIDASNNLYATGRFRYTVDFDPNAGTSNLTDATGYGDIYVLKLDGTGNFMWVEQLGGTYNEGGYSIAIDAFNSIYTTGYFSFVGDYDPSSAVFNLTPVSNYNNDVFVHKLGQGTTGIKENALINSFILYPNPTFGLLNLELRNFNEAPTTIEITNTLGQVVLSKSITENHTQINVNDLSKGICFISIISEGKKTTQKLIIN